MNGSGSGIADIHKCSWIGSLCEMPFASVKHPFVSSLGLCAHTYGQTSSHPLIPLSPLACHQDPIPLKLGSASLPAALRCRSLVLCVFVMSAGVLWPLCKSTKIRPSSLPIIVTACILGRP